MQLVSGEKLDNEDVLSTGKKITLCRICRAPKFSSKAERPIRRNTSKSTDDRDL